MKRVILAVAGLAISACSASAFAWGKVGHAVIADRATAMLTPTAKEQVDLLLDTLGATSLQEIASWADERRNREQGPWHYVNMADGQCRYVRERDCPDDQCLVEQVKPYVRLLADRHADLAQRANALIYVVHFAGGDSSQPLHTGSREDKGGNTYQVRFEGKGTNLHALWDSGLIYEIAGSHSTPRAIASLEATLGRPKTRSALTKVSTSPEAWVEQSCRAWNDPRFYPGGREVDAGYVQWAKPILLRQLELGSEDLAAVLNASLSEGPR